jgi:hypothetical protein
MKQGALGNINYATCQVYNSLGYNGDKFHTWWEVTLWSSPIILGRRWMLNEWRVGPGELLLGPKFVFISYKPLNHLYPWNYLAKPDIGSDHTWDMTDNQILCAPSGALACFSVRILPTIQISSCVISGLLIDQEWKENKLGYIWTPCLWQNSGIYLTSDWFFLKELVFLEYLCKWRNTMHLAALWPSTTGRTQYWILCDGSFGYLKGGQGLQWLILSKGSSDA